jgi:hypothetical protein
VIMRRVCAIFERICYTYHASKKNQYASEQLVSN